MISTTNKQTQTSPLKTRLLNVLIYLLLAGSPLLFNASNGSADEQLYFGHFIAVLIFMNIDRAWTQRWAVIFKTNVSLLLIAVFCAAAYQQFIGTANLKYLTLYPYASIVMLMAVAMMRKASSASGYIHSYLPVAIIAVTFGLVLSIGFSIIA